MKLLIPILFIIYFTLGISSKENSVFTHYGYNIYSIKGDLNQVGNLVECDPYFSDNGFSHQLSLGYRYNVLNKIYIIPNLSYSFQNRIYFNRKDNFSSRNDIDLQIVDINTESRVDIKSNFISPSINIAFNLLEFNEFSFFEKDNIEIIFGSFYRMQFDKSFEQFEQIKSPSNAGFINHNLRQRRNIAGGNVNFLNNQLFYTGGLQYRKDMKNYKLNFGANIAFSNEFLIKNNSISNAEFTLFAGFEYILKTKSDEKIIEPTSPPPILTLPITSEEEIVEETFIQDTFNLKISNDIYKDLIIYEKEELLASTPLVNSIFYDSNNVDIPLNYLVDDTYQNEYLNDIIKAHNVVIPRIIKILRENETSKVQLKAFHIEGVEEQEVIQQRLDNLERILNRFGINSNRIGSQIQKVTDKRFDNVTVMSENFRVDLNLIGATTQKYVKVSKYKELDGKINFDVDFFPDNNANLYISLNNKLLNNIEKGNNEIPIIKEIEEDGDINFLAKLSGSQSEKIFYFNIERDKLKQQSKELDYKNFEAILRFEFNSSVLSEENKQLLKQLYEILPSDIGIKILGSADAIGDSRTNEKLEIERANNTKSYLESLNKKNLRIETGRTNEKFSEDTPQGRFLNRSIRIKLIIE
jgi:outer membrane protein OmpA-like peptidoglycan-associated protein